MHTTNSAPLDYAHEAYIAVHGGAGIHRKTSEFEVKRAIREACTRALNSSARPESTAISLVAEATCVLEDSPHLNAGLGSNLTLDGTVECDAAIMSGDSSFGSVAAVSGVKNPIQLAKSIRQYSYKEDKLGRIPPLTLVSAGATSFARSDTSIQLVPPSSLITESSHDQWKRWKDKLDSNDGSAFNDMPCEMRSELRNIQDTVGAVVWHAKSGAAAGVSSGGLLLKLPGRVGEAAVFGAGCWAQQGSNLRDAACAATGVACSVSGTGEHIVRAQLARLIGERVMATLSAGVGNVYPQNDVVEGNREEENEDEVQSDGDDVADTHTILQQILGKEFWEPYRKKDELSPSAGILLLTKETGENGEASVRLWCAFTTPSMAIGYASPRHPKPKAMILKHPDASNMRNGEKPRIFITAIPL
ncbi:N-terminal nucleophile aminohydrolase [Coprinopsis marcescibilis]|uniref:N-terminal nucleophile aminohydrolase n=1 Tax=Coprinopsis marcescibilis TaxID=230819 RepID=A0A5C3L0P9_COPMA|nr:N-terminal nucleophile aminohydrolase [Coprinopsis marcescibilis]